MDAIEFSAVIKDGRIEIPAEYCGHFPDGVRVIIRAEEASDTDQKADFIAELLTKPLHIPGFVPMTRDEIYRGRRFNQE